MSLIRFRNTPFTYMYLFICFEHRAFETVGRAVSCDVAPYLQVLGIVRHVKNPAHIQSDQHSDKT